MHLKETQITLQDCISSDSPPDPELTKAMEENEVVIGSQEERISILKMALEEKGVLAGTHYDLPSNPVVTIAQLPSSDPSRVSTTNPAVNHAIEDGDNGIHL
ncbi:hypothetical protein BDQ17DRAFT_1349302 [Cyathus striatus]|nr:hypothetical protein BDQ17DRAFT_1349302 [Cyathus striatus]